MSFSRIAIVGDDYGIPMLLAQVPAQDIAVVVVASTRSQSPELTAPLRARGIPLLVQPRRSAPEYAAFVSAFRDRRPDLLLCNSYAMKLGPDLLDIVRGNAINAHAALLPRHRGPNPIQWAIIHGDASTGVTLHYMTDDIDAGDIVAQREVPIDTDDTWVTVRGKIDVALRSLLADELPVIRAGANRRTPQDPTLVTVNHRLTPDSPRIDFERMSDERVYDLIRAQVAPLAGAYLEDPNGKRIRYNQRLTRAEVAGLRTSWKTDR